MNSSSKPLNHKPSTTQISDERTHTETETETETKRKTKQSRAACVHAYLEKAVSTDEEEGAGTGEISDAATGSSAAAAMASIVGSSLRKHKNPNCSDRLQNASSEDCASVP